MPLRRGASYVQGSDDLKALVTKTFVDYGVGHYSPSGEVLRRRTGASSGTGSRLPRTERLVYHTDLDIPQSVPEAGLESVVRAYAKIIDEVNKMSLQSLRVNMGSEAPGNQGQSQ